MATFDLFRNKSLLNNEQFHRQDSDDSIHKICLKNGILTAVILILTFIAFCACTHKLEIHQLSVANMFILAFGVYFALEDFSSNGRAGSIEYFEGFKVGLYTSLISVGIHSLFLLIYSYFDPSVLPAITNAYFYSSIVQPFSVAGVTLFEGLASALVITFCLMQYFKKNSV